MPDEADRLRSPPIDCQWLRDPEVAGRTIWCITGPSEAAVQHQIDFAMRYVEHATGYAMFTNPYRTKNGWQTEGVTKVDTRHA